MVAVFALPASSVTTAGAGGTRTVAVPLTPSTVATILMIDFVNKKRDAGAERTTAILTSARVRLRPIIMTTFAMIVGMSPLALAIGEGAEQRAPMAHTGIDGLIASTLLTLFVVPVVYTLLDDLAVRVTGKKPVTGRRVDARYGD